MKQATIALVVRQPSSGPFAPSKGTSEADLIEVLSDDREIEIFERAVYSGAEDPIAVLESYREKVALEEEDFGNYVEDLLSQPALRPEIRDHGLQWLKSKLRIEQYQQSEQEAVEIISSYAFKVYSQDPEKTDFLLAGPTSHVRVRVFRVSSMSRGAIAA